MRRPLALILLAALCGCGGLVTVPASTQPAIPTVVNNEQTAVVVSITDGDTFRAHLPTDAEGRSTPVRLIGIDTPETRKPNTPVQCYGPEASAALTALIPVGTTVGLVYDKERTDRYDRTLAYVYTVGADGARVDVGGTMVAQGAAVAKRYPPNVAMADAYERAQAIAKADGLGLWGACER
jgi:micrococcal nuclease